MCKIIFFCLLYWNRIGINAVQLLIFCYIFVLIDSLSKERCRTSQLADSSLTAVLCFLSSNLRWKGNFTKCLQYLPDTWGVVRCLCALHRKSSSLRSIGEVELKTKHPLMLIRIAVMMMLNQLCWRPPEGIPAVSGTLVLLPSASSQPKSRWAPNRWWPMLHLLQGPWILSSTLEVL